MSVSLEGHFLGLFTVPCRILYSASLVLLLIPEFDKVWPYNRSKQEACSSIYQCMLHQKGLGGHQQYQGFLQAKLRHIHASRHLVTSFINLV